MNQKTVMDPFVPNSTATTFGVQNDNEADTDKDTGSSEGNCDTFVDVRQLHTALFQQQECGIAM